MRYKIAKVLVSTWRFMVQPIPKEVTLAVISLELSAASFTLVVTQEPSRFIVAMGCFYFAFQAAAISRASYWKGRADEGIENYNDNKEFYAEINRVLTGVSSRIDEVNKHLS